MTRVSPGALRLLALVLVLLLVGTFFASQIENYLNARLFNRISSSVAIVALIACAQTLVILTRNIDLSLGAVVGFTAYGTGALVTAVPDLHPALHSPSTDHRPTTSRHRQPASVRRGLRPVPAGLAMLAVCPSL